MLERLVIKNFVLVENCDISFTEGFTVITGETGAGKSVILSALSLLLGDKAESSLVRLGTQQAVIEGIFSGSILPQMHTLFEELGIDSITEEQLPEEQLIIRREIQATGKSRVVLNGQTIPLASLKKIAPHLIIECGQHAHLRLKDPLFILNLIDQKNRALSAFQDTYRHLKELMEEEKQLQLLLQDKPRQVERLLERIEEIEEAKLQEDEEENLFQKFQHLQSAQEIREQVEYITEALESESRGVLYNLRRVKSYIERNSKSETPLTQLLDHCTSALHELEEASYTLGKLQQIDCSPHELQRVEARLSLYNRLKKRYGSDIQAIVRQCHEDKEALKKLRLVEEELESLQKRLEAATATCDQAAHELTTQRQAKASALQISLEKILHTLSMPHATVALKIEKESRSMSGDDRIAFYFSPNPGEREVEVHTSASGGELARLFLACLLSTIDMEPQRTLLFDEIDANIGGATATIFAQKLQELSQNHQVIAITHFAQVAQRADQHLSIQKEVIDGRTLTSITSLKSSAAVELELQRMLGNMIPATNSQTF